MAVRFAHTSDWHLGAPFPFAPPKVADEIRRLQMQTVTDAVNRLSQGEDRVDLFMVCGGIFHDSSPSPEIIEQARSRLTELRDRGVQACILRGPDDPPDASWAEGTGAHVFVEPGEVQAAGLRIIAIPPSAQRKGENLLRKAASGERFSILMHYGHCVELGDGEDPIHPFHQADLSSLPGQIVALGACHSFKMLKDEGAPKASYSGSPMGVGFGPGDRGPRYVTVGEISGEDARAFPLQMQAPEFAELEWDCSRKEPEALLKRISKGGDLSRLLRVVVRGVPSLRCLVLEETLRRSLKGLLWLDVQSEFQGVELSQDEDDLLQHFAERVMKADDGAHSDAAMRQKALELGIKALMGALDG